MNFKETLEKYFENITKTDNAIKSVYSKDKLNDCAEYIINMARKEASGRCAVISDEVVYKWARDFYLGDIEKDYKPNLQVTAEVHCGAEEPKLQKSKPKKAKVYTADDMEKDQLNLFEF